MSQKFFYLIKTIDDTFKGLFALRVVVTLFSLWVLFFIIALLFTKGDFYWFNTGFREPVEDIGIIHIIKGLIFQPVIVFTYIWWYFFKCFDGMETYGTYLIYLKFIVPLFSATCISIYLFFSKFIFLLTGVIPMVIIAIWMLCQ